MSEKVNHSQEKDIDVKELKTVANERAAEIEKKLELSAENSPEHSAEQLAKDAEKLATDRPKDEKQPVSPAEKRKDTPLPNSKAGRKKAFKTTMKDARSHMSPTARAFSKVIHNKAVEKTSEAIGATVARPNALLAGSVAAFALTLLVYLVARHYGYPLTGSESIAAFIIGWVLGVLFDYLRVMITGKKA